MEPVRVTFLIDRLSRAGTESQLLALIAGLDRQRVAPTLVLLDGTDAESRALEPSHCPVLRLGVTKLRSLRALRAGKTFFDHLRSERTELVLAYFLDSAYFGIPIAKLAGVRHALRVRNNLGHDLTATHRRLGRLLRPLCTATLTNCEPARQAWLKFEGGAPERVKVLENGVDLERFLGIPLAKATMPLRIGAVANLRPIKGLDLLIAAVGLLRDAGHGVQLEIAGEGPQRAELEQQIARLQLGDRVRLVGPTADVPAFLARQSVIACSSHAEGMSNALLEAMAAGRAIVATNVGGNPHLIRHEQTGLLVRPGDAEALAIALARFAGYPELLATCAAAARCHAQRHYSREAMRERFTAYFVQLAGRFEPTANSTASPMRGAAWQGQSALIRG